MAEGKRTIVLSVDNELYERYQKKDEGNEANIKFMIYKAMRYYIGTLEARERRAEKQRKGISR